MIRASMFTSVLALAASATTAQDFTSNVNPSARVGPTVMHSAINAQARLKGARARSSVTQQQVNASAQKSRFRAEQGENHLDVMRLYALCRQAGF